MRRTIAIIGRAFCLATLSDAPWKIEHINGKARGRYSGNTTWLLTQLFVDFRLATPCR